MNIFKMPYLVKPIHIFFYSFKLNGQPSKHYPTMLLAAVEFHLPLMGSRTPDSFLVVLL